VKRPEITSANAAGHFGEAVVARLLEIHSSSHIRWYGLRGSFKSGTFYEFVDGRWNDPTYFSDEDKASIINRYTQLRLER
jgi:hypothetical protein